MAQINLLPWREEYRQEKKKEFISQFIGVCIVSLLVAYAWVNSVNSQIDSQKQRNRMLQQEIDLLSKQVKEIKELKKKRQELIERMKVIQDLEGRRSIIVHYFDEFAKSVPDGIYINSMARKGNKLTVEGVSESNNRISAFMRTINSSEWFADPNLSKVTASPALGAQAAQFSMVIKMVLPKDEKENNNG